MTQNNVGIYASQISGHLYGGPYGAYDALAAVTLSSATATVTFAGIPTGYKHLQVRYLSKSAYTTGTTDSLYAQFNGDTGSNYAYHFLRGDGSSASAGAASSNTFMWLGNLANSGTGTTSIFGSGVCDILDYANVNKNKTIRTLQGYDSNGDGRSLLSSSVWLSTSAVTSITLYFGNGNITANSSFALYGVK